MVTISSIYLPEEIQIASREHLKSVCISLIGLQNSLRIHFGGVQLKPFICVEFTSPTHFARISFYRSVNIDEILSCIPHDVDYQPLTIKKHE